MADGNSNAFGIGKCQKDGKEQMKALEASGES
jgi:hypothetical protein